MSSRCMHNSGELMLIDNTASNLAAEGSAHLTPDDRIGALKLVGLYATDTFQSFSLTRAAESVEPGYLLTLSAPTGCGAVCSSDRGLRTSAGP